jgi:hypothetical protein
MRAEVGAERMDEQEADEPVKESGEMIKATEKKKKHKNQSVREPAKEAEADK